MPSRYEREIEEILNRMEDTGSPQGGGDRIRPFRRRRSARPRSMPTLPMSLIEILFLLAIVFILVASGLVFYDGAPSLTSGLIGLGGLIVFVVALVAGWRDHFRPSTQAQWRRNPLEPRRIRRGPLSAWAEQIRIRRLREQYRRAQEQQKEPDN